MAEERTCSRCGATGEAGRGKKFPRPTLAGTVPGEGEEKQEISAEVIVQGAETSGATANLCGECQREIIESLLAG